MGLFSSFGILQDVRSHISDGSIRDPRVVQAIMASAKPKAGSVFPTVHISSDQDSHNHLVLIGLMGDIRLDKDLHACAALISLVYFGSLNELVRLKADYTYVQSLDVVAAIPANVSWQDVAVLSSMYIKEVTFWENNWSIRYSTFLAYSINTALVKGKFSVLVEAAVSDMEVRLTAAEGTIQGINISLQSAVVFGPDTGALPFQLASPKLKVSFDPSWDAIVTTTPDIVLEADDPNSIEITGTAPSNVKITTASVADRPTGAGPSEPDDGGLSAGAIARIVIACVVVVGAVVGVLVYVLVIRPKKVGGE
jgi:hypothetical protein